MFAVIFEVQPAPGKEQDYLNIHAELGASLKRSMDSLNERFSSLTTPGKILSLSFWRDEAALIKWRQRGTSSRAVAGANSVFADYRLRVASVVCVTTAC